MLVLALADLADLLRIADVTAAMSVEGLLGTDRAFAADLQAAAPPARPGSSARRTCAALLAGSAIVASHRHGDSASRTPYSLRCTPQVHGAARDTVAHAEAIGGREPRRGHRQPDDPARRSGVVARQLPRRAPRLRARLPRHRGWPTSARIAERRTDRHARPSPARHGLPPFLSPTPGVNSGMMIAHYTQAAMVSENQAARRAGERRHDGHAAPCRRTMCPMGWDAARKLRAVIEPARRILAVEAGRAGRPIDLRAPLTPAPATGAARRAARAWCRPGPGPRGSRPSSHRPLAVVDEDRCAAVRDPGPVEARERRSARDERRPSMVGPRPVRAPRTP